MGRHPKFFCLCALFIGIFFSHAQDYVFASYPSDEDRLNREFFIDFKDDFGLVLVSPARWEGKDFLTFSAVLGAGCLLFAVDEDIQDWVQEQRSSASDDIFAFVTHFGHGGVLLGLMTVLYTTGELSHSNTLRKTALLSLESWLTTGLIVLSLKTVIGRARPQTSDASDSFHLFSLKSRFHSLPSGHSSSVFAVATVIADQSKSAFVDALAYSLATLVAFSRVHNNKHWASDVFLGASIGHFVARKVISLSRDRQSRKADLSFHFLPAGSALTLEVSF